MKKKWKIRDGNVESYRAKTMGIMKMVFLFTCCLVSILPAGGKARPVMLKVAGAWFTGVGREFNHLVGQELFYHHEKIPAVTPLQQQQRPLSRITGRVVDEKGVPLPGVTVTIKGTKTGVVTAADGTFVLGVATTGDVVLQFSFIGMEPQEVKYAGEGEVNVTMRESVSQLEDVVVTGIFTRQKESFTGSSNRITGEELKKLSSGNVLRALEMLDPGFRVNASNVAGSNPSAIPEFNMRGEVNIGDYSEEDVVMLRGDVDTRPNQPLFVLDGIIGVEVTKIIDLNPDLIESITLLKDAAAMVVYGSRASNGVIVVETKAPQAGKFRLSYNGNYQLQCPDLTDYNLLNAAEKLEFERSLGYYSTWNPIAEVGYEQNLRNLYTRRKLEVDRGVNTYWLSQPLTIAFLHRHGLNLEGGDRSLRYKLYFGVNQAPGIMKGSGVYSRNGSLTLQYRYQGLLISNQLFIDYTVSDRTSPYGVFTTYVNLSPYYRVRDDRGNLLRVLEYSYNADGEITGTSVLNPMYDVMYNSKDKNTAFEVRDAFRAEYTLANLRLSLDVSLGKGQQESDNFKSGAHSSSVASYQIIDGQLVISSVNGLYDWSRTNKINYDISFTASYNKFINDKHLLSAYAYYTMGERFSHAAGIVMEGFANDQMDEVFLGSRFRSITGSESTSRSQGLLGTISYTYAQRYAADVSVRVDASSEFGRNNRFAPFWSAGARWNLHKETWIQKSSLIDELVLRATYGITGTQGFSPYQSLQMYTYDGMTRNYRSSDVIGSKLASIGNPDLKWQQTDNWNAGLDFNVFKRVVSGRLEYYYKYTRNTLLDYSLPPSVGFATIPENVGNISNKGYEISLRFMPYNDLRRRLNVNFIVNGSHNENKIEKISNALKVRNEESMNSVTTRPLPRYEEGYSQGIIWAVRSLGIDPVTGNEIFLSRDGKQTAVWNAADQVPVGDTEPTLQGSVGLNVNWKDFSLSIAGQYRWGGQVYNRTLVDRVENANVTTSNVDRRALTERWEQPGDRAFFKRASLSSAGTQATSRFVMNNDVFSINTINVQYRFEQGRHAFLRHAGITNLAIGAYMEDIFRVSTVKMERGIDYPFARQTSLSLNIIF